MSDEYEYVPVSEKKLTWSSLLSMTYQLYGERFWTFFRMALVPALLAYVFHRGEQVLTQQHMGRGSWGTRSPSEWYLLMGFSLAEQVFYWSISAFLFAAVAANVMGREDELPALVSDSYTAARNRLGAVVSVGLLVLLCFLVGRGILSFAVFQFVQHMKDPTGLLTNLAFALPILMLAGILCRFGLAVPELIGNTKLSVRQAIRNSVRRSEGWELFFMVFLLKAALLGYTMYWLRNLGLEWLYEHEALSLAFYPWAAQLLTVAIAALLEPPLFIAFSILHRELKVEAAPAAVTAPPAIG